MGGIRAKLAVTLLSAERLTVHWLPLTKSQPVQPANVDPDAAAAVRVTEVPSRNWAEQVAPQSIPPASW